MFWTQTCNPGIRQRDWRRPNSLQTIETSGESFLSYHRPLDMPIFVGTYHRASGKTCDEARGNFIGALSSQLLGGAGSRLGYLQQAIGSQQLCQTRPGDRGLASGPRATQPRLEMYGLNLFIVCGRPAWLTLVRFTSGGPVGWAGLGAGRRDGGARIPSRTPSGPQGP